MDGFCSVTSICELLYDLCNAVWLFMLVSGCVAFVMWHGFVCCYMAVWFVYCNVDVIWLDGLCPVMWLCDLYCNVAWLCVVCVL